MYTTMDKALVAILPGLLLWLNQKYGFKFDVSPENMTAIAGLISAAAVYFIPNKGANA